jgi:[ribosomal protein S18]-alanine N-acetyltransferase
VRGQRRSIGGVIAHMDFLIRIMQPEDASIIAAWHYPEPYSFYDMTADQDDLKEFLDFENWKPDSKYAVTDSIGDLIGFFEFSLDHDVVDVGLGLRPDTTGSGLGMDFVRTSLYYAQERFSPKQFRLSVATLNERAIKVYERVGFKTSKTFMIETNGGIYEFVEMIADVT